MIILRLLARMSACSISSTRKLLFFPDNKGCVLYITKCNHPPPPPRSFFWSTPPQFSAVDSPDNRAPCVIVEGFYYYYSSLQKEKCSKEIAFTRGQLKGQIEFIRQIVVHLVTVTSVDLYMTMTSLGEFICHGKLISVENSLPVIFVHFQVETSFPYKLYFCGVLCARDSPHDENKHTFFIPVILPHIIFTSATAIMEKRSRECH